MIYAREWFKLRKQWLEKSPQNELSLLVLSDSMKPCLCKGDNITLKGINVKPLEKGDIIVFCYKNENATVHRIIKLFYSNSSIILKTKGDANPYEDPYWVTYSDIIGVVEKINYKIIK